MTYNERQLIEAIESVIKILQVDTYYSKLVPPLEKIVNNVKESHEYTRKEGQG